MYLLLGTLLIGVIDWGCEVSFTLIEELKTTVFYNSWTINNFSAKLKF